MSRRYPWLRSGNIGRPSRASRYRPAVLELEPRRLLSTYIVNDSSDLALDPAMGPGMTENGTVSLRSAIQQVNIDGSGSIDFVAPMAITTSGLPTITASRVTIDGSPNDVVALFGNGDAASGLVLAGADDVVRGLLIAGFGGDGIDVGAPGATIGGTTAHAGNDITANAGTGISLGSYGGYALVEGNFMGNKAYGAVSNGGSGIYIGSAGNTIGGSSAAAGNVISSNVDDGIDIAGTEATGNVVAGDFIENYGYGDLGNYTGVMIEGGASDNLIGTAGDSIDYGAPSDVISGNLFAGVCISGSGTTGNVVAGDFIGTDKTGTKAAGNDSLGSATGGGVSSKTAPRETWSASAATAGADAT